MRHPTPKRASANERAIKKGVQGALPPALFLPAFSGESRAPARSRAGNHVAGLGLRWSKPGPPAGGPPPRLFASGLSLEKAWIPRPGPGGNPPRRAHPAMVQTEPPADTAEPPRPHAWDRAPTKNDPFGPLPKRSFFFFRRGAQAPSTRARYASAGRTWPTADREAWSHWKRSRARAITSSRVTAS